MAECKCCGQTLPPDTPPGLKLSRQQRAVYEIIRRAGQCGIYADAIFERIYGNDEDGGPYLKIISVYVCSLNKKLPCYGQRIVSTGWGGRRDNYALYRLVPIDA